MSFNDVVQAILETLAMAAISGVLAYIVGLPLGVILAVTSKKGVAPNKVINTILGLFVNILRSVPCLIIVVLTMPLVRATLGRGTGEWYTILIPLFFASFGYVARVVEQSVSEVPSGEIEAIRSLGATNSQLIFKVLIPEARVALVSGVAVTLINIIGYTSFAYNIGAGGLIADIWDYYSRNTGDYYQSTIFWVLIIIVVVIVQIIQEIGLTISKKIDKRRQLQ